MFKFKLMQIIFLWSQVDIICVCHFLQNLIPFAEFAPASHLILSQFQRETCKLYSPYG